MFNTILAKLRHFSTILPFTGWWLDCMTWWLSRERDYFPALLLGGLGVIITVCSVAILQFNDHRAENRQLTCLALNVYHEARGEPEEGQYAVAAVTLNRVASSRYPNTICEVVYQQKWDHLRRRNVGAFSWTEFDVKPSLKEKAWQQAWQVAQAVYTQERAPDLGGALFYHASSINPSWARHKKPVAHIGRHVFYR